MKKLIVLAALPLMLGVTPVLAEETLSYKSHTQYAPDNKGGFEASNANEITDSHGTTASSTTKKLEIDGLNTKETNVKTQSSDTISGQSNTTNAEVKENSVDVDAAGNVITKSTTTLKENAAAADALGVSTNASTRAEVKEKTLGLDGTVISRRKTDETTVRK